MQKELKVGIADIVISVIFEDKIQSSEVDGSYKYFLTDGKPDVSFYTYYGSTPTGKLGEKVFRTVILESDFKSGDIYIRGQRRKRKIEYPLNYPLGEVLMINLLAQERGVMIHSCGVTNKGEGLLFVGISQMGKSTMANLWKGEKEVTILNDDRIIIRRKNGYFWMYGTPWHGDAKVCSPEKAPLERIFFLRHTEKNNIRKITPMEAMSRLIVCSFPTFWDKKGMEFTLEFCAEIAKRIHCYEMGFVPDESVLGFIRGSI